jgi:endoglycosylceramidase
MRRRFALALAIFAAACSSKVKPYQASFGPVDSDGRVMRDQRGRALILRGVNARVAGVFDVTFDDGRDPREAIPTFGPDDAQTMRAAGFTLVRLPVNWSGIEPMPGQYSTAYLDRVAAVVDTLRGSGVYVLLDLHEDGYSKELCEDGAPLWAIDPPPAMLVGGPGPLEAPTDCHASPEAIAAFSSFFADQNMLQEHYAAMAAVLAKRFAGDEQVLGYEVMNEPIGDDTVIAAFSQKIAQAIRAVDARHLILFEPSASRNQTNFSPISSVAFSVPGAVYSVHIYTGVFNHSDSLTNGTFAPLVANSISEARDEADGWHTPLAITEYGLDARSANAAAWVGSVLDSADAQLAATTLWLWKEQSQGEWGLYTHNADGSWSPRPLMFDAVARPYAPAIGGDPTAITWDGATLTVAFKARGDVPAEHDLYWPKGTPTLRCDGKTVAPMSVDSAGARYTVACGGSSGAHTLTAQ